MARWFAERDRGLGFASATVYVATIEPSSVLAVIESRKGMENELPRGEAEVVVDPAGLQDSQDLLDEVLRGVGTRVR
jgi:hypothetical protein